MTAPMMGLGASRAAYLVSTLLSAVGIPLSVYLISPAGLPEFCEVGSYFSCERVIGSRYSDVLGVPVAALGAAWFTIALILSASALAGAPLGRALLVWSVIGVSGALTLLYVEVFLIGSLCLLCTLAHALGAGVFTAALLAHSWSQPPTASG